MKMYINIMSLFLLCALTTLPLQSKTLTQDIDSLIDETLPQAHVGVMIQDPETKRIIYQRNASKSFSPASNIKLFTAAAALYQLSPQYHYVTSLLQKDNHIYIQFNGSPSLTTEQLKQLLTQLNTHGIHEIKGNLILDTTRFQPPYYAPGTTYDDLGWYYEAPSTSVNLNENTVQYEFISANQLNKPIQIKCLSPEKAINLINKVITVNKEDEKEHCSLNIETNMNNTVKLYGCFAKNDKPVTMKLAIPNPVLYTKQTITQLLKEDNIQLKGQIVEGKTPDNAQKIAQIESEELSKLITHMLQESDNLYADSLTKLLAYTLTGEGTYKQGAFAIKQILAKHTHLDIKQLELADGTGDRYNYTTPEQIIQLLTDVYHSPNDYPIFVEALPHMGISGSLKDRMKKTPLENKIIAKTGTMHDISSLSGYMTLPHQKHLVFSIMINNVTHGIATAKTLEDKILLTVINSFKEKINSESKLSTTAIALKRAVCAQKIRTVTVRERKILLGYLTGV